MKKKSSFESLDYNPEKDNLLTLAITCRDRQKVFSRFGKKPSYSIRENLIRFLLAFFGYLTIAITLAIFAVLLIDALQLFMMVSPIEFFFGTKWEPFGEPKHLGILPLVSGTLMIAFGSALVGIPLGFLTAVYLTQYASKRTRNILQPLIEILGGIPTVVYGYFALVTLTPLFKDSIIPQLSIFNAFTASIVVGIDILPMVASLSSDALRVVPNSIRNAGYALGMTRFHVITKIIIPAATSGIIASFMLAFARAVGETMAVSIAAGSTPNLNFNYFEAVQTMTAFIVQISMGDTPAGSIEYYTIFGIGLALFILTFLFNFIAVNFVRKFREVYK